MITRAPEVTTASSFGKQTLPSRKPLKVVRSTAQPPSTTPLARETKVQIPALKNTVSLTARGSLLGRKKLQEERTNVKDKITKDVEDSILFSTKVSKLEEKKRDFIM